MRRRSLLASASGGNEGGISFPAVIVDAGVEGNENNLNIALYLLEKYPDMVVDSGGKYTPITEDITVQTKEPFSGKVFGIAKFPYDPPCIILYTDNSYPNWFGVRVCYAIHEDFSYVWNEGTTGEWFYD